MLLKNALSFFLAMIIFVTLPIAETIAEDNNNIPNEQLKPFEWDHDSCHCKAQIDTSKISPATAKLLIDELRSFNIKDEVPWTELHKLDLEKLEIERDRYLKEYEVSLNSYLSLEIPSTTVLNRYKNDLMLEVKLRKFMYISELNYLITGSSKHLNGQLEGLSHLSICGKYSQNLNSEQSIINSLPVFIDNQCAKNVNPAECKINLTQKTSDLKNAKIMLLMLEWHNCVNHYYRSKISPNHDDAYEAIKLYLKSIQCKCEEVD